MSYELFMKGPGVYIPVLLISFAATLAAYCFFPLLYSNLRKKPITVKKFRIKCYLTNLIPMFLFLILFQNISPWPYMLWTSVFTSLGIKKLRYRGLLIEQDSNEVKITSVESKELKPDTVQEEMIDEPVVENKKKQRYCKMCVSQIDGSTKKCSGCGKQYFNIRLTLSGAFAVVFFVTSITVGYIAAKSNIKYRSDIAQLKYEISELEETIRLRDSTIKKLKSQISDKNTAISNVLSESQLIKEKLDFYDNVIVFVIDDNTKFYHKYDCNRFVFARYTSAFSAYNIDQAKNRGYSPCTSCCK